jgi:hypothetical protein
MSTTNTITMIDIAAHALNVVPGWCNIPTEIYTAKRTESYRKRARINTLSGWFGMRDLEGVAAIKAALHANRNA